MLPALPLDTEVRVASIPVSLVSLQPSEFSLVVPAGEDAALVFDEATRNVNDAGKAVALAQFTKALVELRGNPPSAAAAACADDETASYGARFLVALECNAPQLYRFETKLAAELDNFSRAWEEDKAAILSLQATQVHELMDASDGGAALSSMVESHVAALLDHDANHDAARAELVLAMRQRFEAEIDALCAGQTVKPLVARPPATPPDARKRPTLLELLSSSSGGGADASKANEAWLGSVALGKLVNRSGDAKAPWSFHVYLGSQLRKRFQISIVAAHADLFPNVLSRGFEAWREHVTDLYQARYLTAVIAPRLRVADDTVERAQRQSVETHFDPGVGLVSNVFGVHAVLREADVTAGLVRVTDALVSVNRVMVRCIERAARQLNAVGARLRQGAGGGLDVGGGHGAAREGRPLVQCAGARCERQRARAMRRRWRSRRRQRAGVGGTNGRHASQGAGGLSALQ